MHVALFEMKQCLTHLWPLGLSAVGVSTTIIPKRPRKSFLEQVVMWDIGLMTQQWSHVAETVLKTAGVCHLSVHY